MKENALSVENEYDIMKTRMSVHGAEPHSYDKTGHTIYPKMKQPDEAEIVH